MRRMRVAETASGASRQKNLVCSCPCLRTMSQSWRSSSRRCDMQRCPLTPPPTFTGFSELSGRDDSQRVAGW
jgi:hypothetical protein